MSTYASNTSVSVEKSRAELESLLNRYGATKFAYMSESDRATVCFVAKGKLVRFTLPLPDRNDHRFSRSPRGRAVYNQEQRVKAWEQACRSRWRSLVLCVKAKLEGVVSGITSFEAEFLAHFVLPNGRTVGEHIIPQLDSAIASSTMPRLLSYVPEGEGSITVESADVKNIPGNLPV